VGLYPGETIFRCYERILGTAKAANFLTRGAMLTADEALAAGLVDELVEPDQVIARAVAIGQEIAALPPMTYSKTRALVRADLVRLVEHPTESLASLMQAGWVTDETRERMAALLR
jgi:enoyl-CoA hydratase/carnithine racemase